MLHPPSSFRSLVYDQVEGRRIGTKIQHTIRLMMGIATQHAGCALFLPVYPLSLTYLESFHEMKERQNILWRQGSRVAGHGEKT